MNPLINQETLAYSQLTIALDKTRTIIHELEPYKNESKRNDPENRKGLRHAYFAALRTQEILEFVLDIDREDFLDGVQPAPIPKDGEDAASACPPDGGCS